MAAFFNTNKMKTVLTIKAIIRWEQLRGKSFSLMDYSDRDDIEALLYTTTICSGKGKPCTFNVFRQTLSNERLTKDMLLSLEKHTVVLSQFQRDREMAVADKDTTVPGRVSDIVATLIMAGLDPHFIYYEMDICDIGLFINAYESRKKEEMESARMWTYFSMLPHIDGKKMKNGARDIVMFPWEEEEARIEAERAIKEDSMRFEEIMKTKKTDYYGK